MERVWYSIAGIVLALIAIALIAWADGVYEVTLSERDGLMVCPAGWSDIECGA